MRIRETVVINTVRQYLRSGTNIGYGAQLSPLLWARSVRPRSHLCHAFGPYMANHLFVTVGTLFYDLVFYSGASSSSRVSGKTDVMSTALPSLIPTLPAHPSSGEHSPATTHQSHETKDHAEPRQAYASMV